MYLLKLGQDKWTVYAYADSDGNCEVLDFLASLSGNDKRLAAKMAVILYEHVPQNGPQKDNENFCKKLRDHTFEFKRGHKRGVKIRVLFFYDRNNVVICTCGLLKTNKTPQNLIDKNERVRKDYLKDKADNKIKVLT